MKSFKQFITLKEGGNLSFTNEKGEKVFASAIPLEKREELKPNIQTIINGVRQAIGEKPVPSEHFHKLMVGSSEHFHNSSIPDSKFKEVGKTRFGDQDVLLPNSPDHIEKAQAHLQPGTKHGEWTLLHAKHDGKKGAFTLWNHPEHGVMQVDFNYDHHKTQDGHNLPTESARFSKSSPAEDLFGETSLKGMAHKYAIASMTYALGKPVSIQMKTKRVPGVDYYPFAVSALGGGGIRKKTEPVLDKDNKPKVDPESGHHIHVELPSKGAKRIQEPKEIADTLIKSAGKTPHPSDADDLHSMHGVHRILKRHFDSNLHKRYVESMADRLYGSKAQPVSRHDLTGGKENDHAVKKATMDTVLKSFPEHNTPELQKKLKEMKSAYNQRMAKRKPS